MTNRIMTWTRTFRVGKFKVVMSFPKPERGRAGAIVMEWSPYTPKRLTPAELEQYRQGRDAAVAELAEATGMTTMVVEV